MDVRCYCYNCVEEHNAKCPTKFVWLKDKLNPAWTLELFGKFLKNNDENFKKQTSKMTSQGK